MSGCCQTDCQLSAYAVIYWPGGPPKPMCTEHALKAKEVSRVLGFYLHAEPLRPLRDPRSPEEETA